MNTLDYILKKFNITFDKKMPMPIEIPNIGRNQLAVLFAELEFKRGVEIGVLAGEYSEILCKNNTDLELFGIDPYEAYSQHRSQKQLDRFKEEAKTRLGIYKNYHFIEKSSRDAVKEFENKSLDFVYIDGNHDFENVTADVTLWSQKVRPGGIISGHDFIRRREPTNHYVVQAVTTYIRDNNVYPWFLLGLNAKIPGMIRDRHRSWMWVKT